MPFEKGNALGGKPRKSNPASMAAKEHALKAIQVLVEAMADEKAEIRIKAAESIINRAWGKPTESVEVTGEEGGPIENTFTVVFKKPDAS